MAKCFHCKKKFGFREESYNLKDVEPWCRFYISPEDAPEIQPNAPVDQIREISDLYLKCQGHEPLFNNQHIMQNKDKICKICLQTHTLIYHIIPFYEEIKFGNFQDDIPIAVSEGRLVIDGIETSTETFTDIYFHAINRIQKMLDEKNLVKECIWCKKQFKEQIPRIIDSIKNNESIPVTLDDSNNIVGFTSTGVIGKACGECKKIISEFNSEKLRDLRKEITRERNKLDRINSLIQIRSSSHGSAQLGQFINSAFSLLGSRSSQFQSETSSQTEQTAGRLLKEVEAERDEVLSNIEFLENEINQELDRLSEEHFLQKKPTTTETKLTTDVIEKNFCIHCGTQLVPNAKFCGKCGNSI